MTPRATTAAAVGASAAVLGAAYWRHLSPSAQQLGRFPSRSARTHDERGRPLLALTFDDGPQEPFTSQVAELLERRGLRGTFFQVGRCVERHPRVTAALAAAGHVVGNHSYGHRFERGWTEPAVRAEVLAAQDVLGEVLGRRPLLYRPPWLIRTPATYRVLDELGLEPVSGRFCHPLEPLQPRSTWMAGWADALVARPGQIVIFHDGYDDKGADRSQTVAALDLLLDRWQAEGYAFTTVDELLGLPAYDAA
ncbi:polysaccharide deacetylase family protein [Nocardioides sp.]|uniref:polysaccharide deacetylase family protein n=1 Tax=Nocardioides sp. TaxID=35761 RepID=UPI00352968A8